MTINSRVPMVHFSDGPRTHQPDRNTLDAAIDRRPYRLNLKISGTGAGELLFRADMRYKKGYIIHFDGEKATLFRLRRGKRKEIVSAPAPLGKYALTIAGSRFTLKDAHGGWVWKARDRSIRSGVRMRFDIGDQKWTTVGRLL